MSRTILIAGGYPHHLPRAVIAAFAEAGWQAEFFDLSPESPWHRPFVKPVRKLIHNLRIKRHPETFDKTIISNLGWRSHHWWKQMQRLKPDAALILRGARLHKKKWDQKCGRTNCDPSRPNPAHGLTDKERQDHSCPNRVPEIPCR